MPSPMAGPYVCELGSLAETGENPIAHATKASAALAMQYMNTPTTPL